MSSKKWAGVDWAGDHWLAVTFESKSHVDSVVIEDEFSTLAEEIGDCEYILMDVPIGLPSKNGSLEERDELDSNARSFMGRPSSVFPVPAREAAKEASAGADYDEVAEKNEEAVGKGLNRQSFFIADGIGDVDAYLRDGDELEETFLESHPEVCFRAFKGDDLEHSKTTAQGIGERLKSLEEVLKDDPGDILYDIAVKLLDEEDADVTVDDVLDAVVLGATALEPDEFVYLTPDGTECSKEQVPRDEEDLPIQMVYREPQES